MPTHNEMDAVLQEVLEKITPTKADKAKMEAIAKSLEQKVILACKEFGVDAKVRLEGSVAKDTWLKGEPDIDVFMRLPTSVSRGDLGVLGLKIAKKALEDSKQQIERFAEHPYLEAFVDGVRVNVVPCYDTKPVEWLSATDRTPFHTDYVNAHLNERLRGEVRLLKKFMKGINVYGAEIKVGGFSGYLCELLVLYYGSFVSVLQAFAEHVPKRVIDMEKHFAGREREVARLFPEPLVIIDPVDRGRNVASAVHPQRLHVFVGAAREFLKRPSSRFFYPQKLASLGFAELKVQFSSRGSTFVFVVTGGVKAVPDVLWGQIYKSQRALRRLLELNDFSVFRSDVWSSETADCIVFVFELEQQFLPAVKKHLGPPLERQKECADFLAKYLGVSNVVAGPYLEGGRWVVLLKRKVTDAVDLLKTKLVGGGKEVGVAELIAKALRQNFKVLVGVEVVEGYVAGDGFGEFLTGFLLGKPFWLSPQERVDEGKLS
ncbi:MAG: CCA tRNA nucleotidyltransferase [Candidatus Bathyarchaeota archaeon]|nr:CCA tRNA nucleotidyltransferase [Candidatus Bathyarchaeota archaeon]